MAHPQSQQPLLLSLDLAPDGRPEADIFGQRQAREVLGDLVVGVLRARRDGDPTELGPRQAIFALLGRYGQGKSTVLRGLRREIEDHALDADHSFRRLRVHEFDVARHRPDDLNYAFDSLIAEWRPRNQIIFAGVAVSALALILFTYSYWAPLKLPAWTQSAPWLSIVATSGWSAFIAFLFVRDILRPVFQILSGGRIGLFRRIGRAWNEGDGREFRRVLSALLRAPPDLLIVDNLDRAVTDQQRAFLLALRRHRSALPPVVVVAFDETPLTLSDPNPEAPQELLAKTFTSAVRFYPMSRNDTIGIVLNILSEINAKAENWGRHPAIFYRHMHVAGDLARIFLFHRRHSVRFCRQFVNVISSAASTLGIKNPHDFSALMRLQGLFEFLPWIRHDPLALAAMLDAEDTDRLLAYATSLAGKTELPLDIRESVRSYLHGTRHMQPAYSGWSFFIGRFVAVETPEQPLIDAIFLDWGPAGPKELREIHWARLERWIKTDLELADEHLADRRSDIYERELARSLDDEEHVISQAFLLQRLWQGDVDFKGQRFRHDLVFTRNANRARLAAVRIVPFWWPPPAGVATSSPPISPPPLAVQRQFFFLAWPLPAESLDPYVGAMAAAHLGHAGVPRGVGALKLWLERLLTGGAPRRPGFFRPFGELALAGDAAVQTVLDCLPRFPESLNGDEGLDWPLFRRLADLRGRFLRDQEEAEDRAGNGDAIRPLVQFAVMALGERGGEADVVIEVLRLISAAFPGLGGPPDGRWMRAAVDEFAPVFASRADPLAEAAFGKACGRLRHGDEAAALVLLVLAAGDATSFATIARRWRPIDAWAYSYIEAFLHALGKGGLAGRHDVRPHMPRSHLRGMRKFLRAGGYDQMRRELARRLR